MWTLEEARKDYLSRKKIKKLKKKRVCGDCLFSTYRRCGMDDCMWCKAKEEMIAFGWLRAKMCRYYTK